MSMWTVIVKNSGSDQSIDDLGIIIPDSNQITLSDQFTYNEIANSDDLRSLVSSGDIVINDGINDLSPTDGVKFLSLENLKELEENYYSKTQLSTSGQSSIHWNNITSAPAFGSVHWLSPVKARVLTISSDVPVSPNIGDFYVDSDDNHLYKYSGSWIDQGDPSVGDRVINLDSTSQSIFEFNGSSWIDQEEPLDNDSVLVDDDGDGNPAQFVYQFSDFSWLKIGDYDFTQHLNGQSSKHDASEIDVEGTYSDIPGSPSNLETTISNIDSQVSIAITQSLDKAYDGYTSGGVGSGSGSGRTVNADQGSVKIDTGLSTNSPLELVPKSTLPTTGLSDGQLSVKDGILFVYDNTRGKWLSVSRSILCFGRKGLTRNQYLDHFAGGLSSNNSGLRMARDAVIVSLAAQFDVSGTGTFQIRKNDGLSITNLSLSSSVGEQSTTVNIDLDQGDFLQCYLSSSSNVQDPIILVEIAWRS